MKRKIRILTCLALMLLSILLIAAPSAKAAGITDQCLTMSTSSSTTPLTIQASTASNSGNGWEGCVLQVYEDGALIKTINVGAGYSGMTTEITYDPAKMYEFRWVHGSNGSTTNAQFEIRQGSTVLYKATDNDCHGFMDQQNCYILTPKFTLDLTDTYGDGWNGNKLQVYADGTLQGEYTIPSGSKTATHTIPRTPGKTYEFRWYQGTYPKECSFSIRSGSKTLYSATTTQCGNFTSGATVYTTAPYVVTSGNCAHSNGSTAQYALYSDGRLVISGSGEMAYYETYSRAPWWSYRGYIQKVEIGSGITSIGSAAFYGCSQLTNVTFQGSSVYYIRESAFYNCDSLGSISIPGYVTSIGDTAFAFCSALRTIVLPSSVKTVGANAFWDCTSLQNCAIYGNLTSLGKQAFCGCISLYSISLPNTITSLGDGAFYNCASLSSVNIPTQITSLPYATFRNCTSLQQVQIPANIRTVGSSAFSGCTNLSKITFLGDAPTFENTLGIFQNVTATACYPGGNDTWTGDVKQSYGGNLTWQMLSCTDLGKTHTWTDATCLAPKTCSTCAATEGAALSHTWSGDTCTACGAQQLRIAMADTYGDGWNGNKLEVYVGGQLTNSLTFTSGKTYTWTCTYDPNVAYTFKWIKSNFPNECSFTISLGGSTLYTSPTLANIASGATLYTLCQHTWQEVTCETAKHCPKCGSTEGAALGHDWADATCETPKTCARCGSTEGAKLGHSWNGTTCATCGATHNITLNLKDSYGDGWNGNCLMVYEDGQKIGTFGFTDGKTATRQVPYDTSKVYTFLWDLASYPQECSFDIVLDGEVLLTIGENRGLEYVTDNQYLAYLADGEAKEIFTGGSCGASAYWVLGNDGQLLIYGTGPMSDFNDYDAPQPWKDLRSNITSVVIRDGITKLGGYSFYGCENLSEVSIPGSVKLIAYHAFYGCTGLTSLALPEGLLSIGEYAFSGSGITTLALPTSVKLLGANAFQNAASLQQVVFYGDVPTIGDSAFGGVTADVYYDRLNETWTEDVLLLYGGQLNWLDGGCEMMQRVHTWADATCLAPKTCSTCGDTQGEPLGHSFVAATCLKPKTCSVCSATEGEPLGHSWTAATCIAAEKCTRCYTTQGSALGHTWVAATCSKPKTCSVCNVTSGLATNNHVYDDDLKCTACGKQCQIRLYLYDDEKDGWDGAAALSVYRNGTKVGTYRVSKTSATYYVDFTPGGYYEFKWTKGTYDEECEIDLYIDSKSLFSAYSCKNYTDGQTIFTICSHSWTAATCESPKACSLCGITEGEPTGHSWLSAACGEDITCAHCSATNGVRYHTWENPSSYSTKCAVCGKSSKIRFVFEGAASSWGSDGSRIYLYPNGSLTTVINSGSTGTSYAEYNYTPNSYYIMQFVSRITKPSDCKLKVYIGDILMYEADGNYLSRCVSSGYGSYIGTLCEHRWKDATCTASQKCNKCSTTGAAPLGHDLVPATCEKPISCTRCDYTEGEKLGHTWSGYACTTCYLTALQLTLSDDKGDGWNGARLEIYENGALMATVTHAAGSSQTIKYGFHPDSEYYFKWYGGEHDGECSFSISVGSTSHFSAGYAECGNFPDGKTVYAICEHTWQDATCTVGKTCSKCGYIGGIALGHTWQDATCETPKTCSVCNTTEGEPLGHDWQDATCENPKTCARCQLTEGEPLGHTWLSANCASPKRCPRCGATEGEKLSHMWEGGTCTEAGFCLLCGEAEAAPMGHDMSDWTTVTDATCTEPGQQQKTCSRCDHTETQTIDAPGHSYENNVCTGCGHTQYVTGDISGDGTVDHNDAIYLLLHVLFGQENYPISGAPGDIDHSGAVDHNDAVYLLLHSLFGAPFYPLT